MHKKTIRKIYTILFQLELLYMADNTSELGARPNRNVVRYGTVSPHYPQSMD